VRLTRGHHPFGRAHTLRARVARAPGGVRFRARYLLSQEGIDSIDPAYYAPAMAMGRRKDRARTPGLWIATNELPPTGGHPFYQRLNQVLDTHGFDEFVEAQCASFYAATRGRPSLTPGTYFRLLLIGYFEGIDSERGIAWRTADSLALRGFLGLGLDEAPPEHSTISRTRRLIDLETHRAVFTWILQVLATADLVNGKTIGVDATTLEANAALRSIVRRGRPARSSA
jgi:transposase